MPVSFCSLIQLKTTLSFSGLQRYAYEIYSKTFKRMRNKTSYALPIFCCTYMCMFDPLQFIHSVDKQLVFTFLLQEIVFSFTSEKMLILFKLISSMFIYFNFNHIIISVDFYFSSGAKQVNINVVYRDLH